MKKVLYFVLILAALYVGMCFLGKEKITFTVSKELKASPEAVFDLLSDYQKTAFWNPWQMQDTSMKLTFGAVTKGMDASYSWVSKDMGTGSQKTTECVPNQKLVTELNFKDWNSISRADYLLSPNTTNGTKLDWVYSDVTSTPFYLRGMFFALNMETKLKKDFEMGLTNIENYLAKNPTKPTPIDSLK
jgi:uncharacterized protein YndB with AHSA1/START domain